MSEPDEHSKLLADALAGIVRRAVKQELNAILSNKSPEEDRMLKIAEAAKVLDVSEDWLYRHKDSLPFARKLGRGLLRFSSKEIQKWLATRKVSS